MMIGVELTLKSFDEIEYFLWGTHPDRAGFSSRNGTAQRKKSVFILPGLWQKSVQYGL